MLGRSQRLFVSPPPPIIPPLTSSVLRFFVSPLQDFYVENFFFNVFGNFFSHFFGSRDTVTCAYAPHLYDPANERDFIHLIRTTSM